MLVTATDTSGVWKAQSILQKANEIYVQKTHAPANGRTVGEAESGPQKSRLEQWLSSERRTTHDILLLSYIIQHETDSKTQLIGRTATFCE